MAKMKRRKLMELDEAIENVGDLKGVKFTYAMAKNVQHIKVELELMSVGLKSSKRHVEYDKKRKEICTKFAKKDENGKILKVPSGPQGQIEFVIDDHISFDKEIDKLKVEYKDELDRRKNLETEYNESLDEEIDFPLYMCKNEFVPKDINVRQRSGIVDLIDDIEEATDKKVEESAKKEMEESDKGEE